MPDLDLTGEIVVAIDNAAAQGHAVVLGYVGADGSPSLSFRGSAQVLSKDQVAVWARKPDEGLAAAATAGPKVSLLYFSRDTPGAAFVSIKGRARLDPAVNQHVYDNMIELERNFDPERKGVAVVIDVDSVDGAGAEGFFHMERA
jgi:Pyridoxamine 5'-phosphate oxidase